MAGALQQPHASLCGRVAHLSRRCAAPALMSLVEAGELGAAAAVGQLAMGCAIQRRAARTRRGARRRGGAVLVGLGGRRAGERRMGGRDAASNAAALMHLQLDGVLFAGGRHQLDEGPGKYSHSKYGHQLDEGPAEVSTTPVRE